MKRNLSRVFLAAAMAAAIAPCFSIGEAEEPKETRRLPLVKYVEPTFPADLRFRGVTSGHATVWVTADAAGRLIDAYAIEYSYPQFADAALAAIKHWTFDDDPAAPRASRFFPVRFNFIVDGLIVVDVHEGDDLRVVERFGAARHLSTSYSFEDLDKVPNTIHAPIPLYPEALKPERKAGRVEILFHVDKSGRVRVPLVTYSDDPRFTEAAMDAFSHWSFSVPTRNGRPSSAFSLQRFTFGPTAAAGS